MNDDSDVSGSLLDHPTTIFVAAELQRYLAQATGQAVDVLHRFPDDYWRELDKARAYPQVFVEALTESRYLAALIPTIYRTETIKNREPDA